MVQIDHGSFIRLPPTVRKQFLCDFSEITGTSGQDIWFLLASVRSVIERYLGNQQNQQDSYQFQNERITYAKRSNALPSMGENTTLDLKGFADRPHPADGAWRLVTSGVILPPHNPELATVNTLRSQQERTLVKACRDGDYEAVLALLSKGVRADIYDPGQLSPLHWISSFREPQLSEVARLLVKAGAKVDDQSRPEVQEFSGQGLSMTILASGAPLHRAVLRNNLEAASCLIQLGASPLQQTEVAPHHSPLTLACALHLAAPRDTIKAASSPSTKGYHATTENHISLCVSSMLELMLRSCPNFRPNETYMFLSQKDCLQ